MMQNVQSFLKNHIVWFQIVLGVWQILKFTPPAALIKGLMGRLLSFLLPGFFPAYKQLQHCPGCLFKTVKCVVLNKGTSQSKTNPLTNPNNQDPKNNVSAMTQANPSTSQTQVDPIMSSTASSKLPVSELKVKYLGEKFEVTRKGHKGFVVVEKVEGEKVSVQREMSYYISDRQWTKICQMGQKCFKKEASGESEKEKAGDGEGSDKEKAGEGSENVVFVKGCRYIWQKVATGKIMEFGEVLDDVIFENNNTLLISDNVSFLPVDLSEESEGKIPKLLNLAGFFFNTPKKPSVLWTSFFTIASAISEVFKPLRSWIVGKSNKKFCGLVQYICNKLPYSVRESVYLLFIWVENMKPRNDIRLKVEPRDPLNVFIGGAAKTSRQDATREDWLDKAEKYEFRCGCSIVMKATYDDDRKKCTATIQHTNAVFGSGEERVFVKCQSREEFRKIGTFLWCLSTSKAGSLIKYDCNDNKVHVRGWRESLRHYKEAGFPDIYKLTFHDVIV